MAKNQDNKQKRGLTENRQINIWAMIRDTLIASMNKGQLPLMAVILIILVLVSKLDAKEAANILNKIIDLLVKGSILGYALFGITLLGWFVHVKVQRRIFSSEINRLSEERTTLQEKLYPGSTESSRR